MGRRRKSRSIKPKAEKVGARLYDPGPDEGGRYSPSPFMLQHGHVVEVAPRSLRSSPDSSFPKRIATQRMIDRYRVHGFITPAQWAAASRLWELFHGAGWNPRITSGYSGRVDNDTTHSAQLSHRIEAADQYLKAMMAVPYRAKGVVIHVVIIDSAASDWARVRGYSARDSRRHGLDRLRGGLSALARHFGY